MKSFSLFILGLSAAALLACSDDTGSPPVNLGELGVPDGFGELWDCPTPGTPCESHNACVLSAICGNDRKCHPTNLQNCDDSLDCTQDLCKGKGVCSNVPHAGTCALSVKIEKDGKTVTETRCFKDRERNPSQPCELCVASGDASNGTAWSPANGGPCDDQNGCTKNDYCQDGLCKGEDFRTACDDKLSCTDDLCDGKGGCLEHKLRSDWCLIEGVCAKDQQQDPTGCKICDIKTSQSAWTPLTVKCTIEGKCYKPGQKDASACAECDPTKNPSGWTMLPGVCKVGTLCYQSGTAHAQGCATCDPQKNPNGWTVASGSCLVSDLCYKSGDKDSTSCLSCDPVKSNTAWTPVPDTCKIGAACYKTGAPDPSGCATCDPQKSTTSWTIKAQSCLIGATCYQQGQTNTSGCGVCDSTKSNTTWSAPANKCLIGKSCYANLDKDSTTCRICDVTKSTASWTLAAGVTGTTSTFDDGKTPAGWTITNTSPAIGWVVTNRRAGQGSHSLYYGDPTTGSFELMGGGTSGDAVMPSVTLPAGKKAGLAFLIYLDTEAWFPLAPVFEVQVNGTVVWTRPATNFVMREWQDVLIDLSAYVGKSVAVRFRVDSTKSLFNFGEGVYLDAVTLFYGC